MALAVALRAKLRRLQRSVQSDHEIDHIGGLKTRRIYGAERIVWLARRSARFLPPAGIERGCHLRLWRDDFWIKDHTRDASPVRDRQ